MFWAAKFFDNVSLPSLKFVWWAPEILLISARMTCRLFKVIQVINVCADRKHVSLCDFLLVRNSNLGPILHCFGDLTAFMCS